jgi:mannose-6-phosphate isomerase-like protein (cupin superfamily)
VSFPPVDTSTTASPPSSKGFVLGPDEGDAYWWLGSTTLTKLGAGATGGNLDIVDHRVPAGYAPPPHVHRGQDEVFYIIDGQFSVRCGDDHWQAGPGSLVFLPRLVPHGFTVSDAGPGRTLLINAPAGFADLIVDLGTATTSLELPGPDVAMPDPDRIKSESESHGIFAP